MVDTKKKRRRRRSDDDDGDDDFLIDDDSFADCSEFTSDAEIESGPPSTFLAAGFNEVAVSLKPTTAIRAYSDPIRIWDAMAPPKARTASSWCMM